MDLLFAKGRSKTVFPLKLIYSVSDKQSPSVQVVFVVPKKKFKRANERNVLKRRMREAYRLNKAAFYKSIEGFEPKPVLALLYIGDKEESYAVIKTCIVQLMAFLTEEIASKDKQKQKIK